ncbi:MAG: hypothetical protein PHN79_09220 [Methanoregula sp.]|nr:hypothetical protein [Methanoregula sp.]
MTKKKRYEMVNTRDVRKIFVTIGFLTTYVPTPRAAESRIKIAEIRICRFMCGYQ